MKIKLVFLLSAVILVFTFPQKVKATQTANLFYIKADKVGNEYLKTENISVEGCFTSEQKAKVIFEKMFSLNKVEYIPENTKLLNVYFLDNELFLDVSKEILNYGGTYNEKRLVAQIVKTAIDLPRVDKFTLIIEGELKSLPEGTVVKSFSLNDIEQETFIEQKN